MVSFILGQTVIDKQVKRQGEKYHLLTVAAGNQAKKINRV